MASTQALLVELGTEELPPKTLEILAEAFAAEVAQGLTQVGLTHGAVETFATPRRLSVIVHDVPVRQADQRQERRGPALSRAFDANARPTTAAQGFARACGVNVTELDTLKTPQGAWLVFRRVIEGLATPQLIPGIIHQALARLPIARRMRWGTDSAEFVRPVHWVVMLFGTEVISAEILKITADRITYGHRVHHPGPLKIEEPREYAARLEGEGRVIAGFSRRRQLICEQVAAHAQALDGRALIDEALLDEVTALTEWPQALAGSFDPQFLALPPEVLISTMQDHQRYFPVVDAHDRLMPHFIVVANLESQAPEVVRRGNERVIRPRFADAAFFFAQDQKHPLASRREALEGIVFQVQLGSLLAKSERLVLLTAEIAQTIGADPNLARRAAELAKCDLITGMVGEFPKLQGIMGMYYARHDGEPEAVAQALKEQYLPRHAGDVLPITPIGRTLALADRIDTLVGIFAIGQRPTGEKDPFGLRRAAVSVLRIIIEGALALDIEALCIQAAAGLPASVAAARVVPEVVDYILDRFKALYIEQGIAPDVIDAVLARRPTRPLDFDRRVRAVAQFRGLPEGESLSTANKRIRNILRQADEAALAAAQVDTSLLQEAAEQALYYEIEQLYQEVLAHFDEGAYDKALARLARLRTPVDHFFDQVMVLTEDIRLRRNRLVLLNKVSDLFLRVADLSRLQGPPG